MKDYEFLTSLSRRCSVCETPTRSLALHSQSMDVPKCPQNWQELWIGYSFIMVSDHTLNQNTTLHKMSIFHMVLVGFHMTTQPSFCLSCLKLLL